MDIPELKALSFSQEFEEYMASSERLCAFFSDPKSSITANSLNSMCARLLDATKRLQLASVICLGRLALEEKPKKPEPSSAEPAQPESATAATSPPQANESTTEPLGETPAEAAE